MATPKLKDKINFTEEQMQILNGALIGDGCLSLHKHGANAILAILPSQNNMLNLYVTTSNSTGLEKGLNV